MLTEQGRVVAIDGDGLWVETLKVSACGQCRARHGCGQKLLSETALKSNMTIVKAYHTLETQETLWTVGDEVVLGVEENAFMLGTLVAYGVPLLGMIAGLIIGNFLSAVDSGDGFTAVGAACGLIGGGALVKLIGKAQWQKRCFQAFILGGA